MRISYNEFHISRNIRNLCSFNEGLFASSGNVIFANMKNVRDFQLLFNNYIETQIKDENKKVSAGQLNAMGLIDEILHHVCMLYRHNKAPTFMSDLIAQMQNEFTKEEIDNLLLDFIQEFPPVEVYKEKTTAEEYLNREAIETVKIGKETRTITRTNREQTLEELILLHLANENPAFKPFAILFDDSELSKNELYNKTWATIQKFAKTQETYGPFDHDLINLLREPMLFAPESLKGQLEYIEKHWAEYFKDLIEWIKRIFAGMDTISEEEKASWAPIGGDGPDLQPYSYENLMNEYERFSADSEWMPNVILMAKTVLVWLDQLTKQYGYEISRLDQIPDAELDKLKEQGFTGLWLIGLWERSKASKRIKQICGNPEAAASAYSLYDYNIAYNIGGWDALANLRQRLWQRGIRLASDMVPNHTGMDGDWVMNKPDLFIQRKDCPFPHYTFNGENLSQDPRTSIYLEDHYYSKDDCSVVFKRVDNQTGDVRYIYHGNDGTGLPWNDTAQIDFLNPAAREAVMQEILHVAKNFPIIRFDAAMVLAKKSIRRLWYPEPGHGGDIATRSETGLSTQQFNDAIPNEFWREVVDRVAKECPDTLLLAEAFWMMEGYFVRTLGMHRVYNSAFMNMLKKEENQKYRETVKNTITFDPQVLKRYVNFMNNPDEETAIAQFGDGDKYFGCCTLMITMPGLPMFGHGQIEGFTEKYGMEYTKAYKDEKPSDYLVSRHYREIFPIMKKRYLFSGVENFLFYDLWQDGYVNENVFAYSNGAGNERVLVFYNNKYDQAHGWIKLSDPYAEKTGNGDEIIQKSRTLSEGLNLTAEDDKYCIFQEHKSQKWFIRKSKDICEQGLFVMLNGFEYQIFMNIQQVSDTEDNRYKILCEFLNGAGCEDLETAWQELIYKDIYESFVPYAKETLNAIEQSKKIVKPKKSPSKTKVSTTKKVALQEEDISKKIEYKYEIKTLKTLLAKVKDDAEVFFEKSNNFVNNKKLKVVPEKQFALVQKRIVQIAQLHNKEKLKNPEDLQKTLEKTTASEKFLKLIIQNKPNLEQELMLLAICGAFAETGYAEEWNFARKFNELQNDFSKEYENKSNYEKPFIPSLRTDLIKLFALAKVSNCAKLSPTNKTKYVAEQKTLALSVAKTLVQEKYANILSGINNFDNIWWFNKELSDESLAIWTTLALLFASPKQTPEVLKLYKLLGSAKLKAAYKCQLFVQAFEEKKKPVAKKKKQ